MQATMQFVDHGALTMRGSYPSDRFARPAPTCRAAPISLADPKSRSVIIDMTKTLDYVPTKAQLLAAELAEELYGAQVTFVQADPSNFMELVQKLTGSGSSTKAASSSVKPTGSGSSTKAPSSSVKEANQSRSVTRVLRTFSSGTETSGGRDSETWTGTSEGEAAIDEQRVTLQRAVSSPGARSHESEHNSSCSTSGSAKLTPGLAVQRNSTFKQDRRLSQAGKKMGQMALSLNIGSSNNVRGSASPNCTSPATPFAIQETFEYSPTPSFSQGNSANYNCSSVSLTTSRFVFPQSYPTTPTFHRGNVYGNNKQVMATNVKVEMPESYPSSPCSHWLGNRRPIWQPQLLSLFPQSPAGQL